MATRTPLSGNRPLNTQAQEIQDAEHRLRMLAKDAFLLNLAPRDAGETAAKIISECERKMKIPALAEAVRRSLSAFYRTQLALWGTLPQRVRMVLLSLCVLSSFYSPQRSGVSIDRARDIIHGASGIDLSGIPRRFTPPGTGAGLGSPLHKWHAEYMRNNVRPILDRIERDIPRDPDDVRSDAERRNSLRNRAEMEVRYNDHQEQIRNLRESGARLVIASTHSDCSERCAPWQGRVFSLDGTTGRTSDGRAFVPLENATDVKYVTRAGKVYNNGLLGFNCRHYLVAFKDGFHFAQPSAKEEQKQYAVTLEQRRMERDIRASLIRASEVKGIDPARFAREKARAAELTDAYKAFSRENGRAYYPSRITIL